MRIKLCDKTKECEEWKNKYYSSTTEVKADLIKQLNQLKVEGEALKKELHKNFEEKDKLHLIIDRLLEASGYDTNTASAEDFEDVYENMRYVKQQLDQLKAENELLQEKIKAYDEVYSNHDVLNERNKYKQALQEIRQVVEFAMEEVLTIGQRNATAKILEILQKCEVINEE